MRYLPLLTLALLLTSWQAAAQEFTSYTTQPQSIVEQLTTHGVTIEQDERLTNRMGIRNDEDNLVQIKQTPYLLATGYRVQVFSNNNQRVSKDEATNKEEQLKEYNPLLETYILFNSPFWRLRVGNCTTYEEAAILQHELKEAFPEFASEMRIVYGEIHLPITQDLPY